MSLVRLNTYISISLLLLLFISVILTLMTVIELVLQHKDIDITNIPQKTISQLMTASIGASLLLIIFGMGLAIASRTPEKLQFLAALFGLHAGMVILPFSIAYLTFPKEFSHDEISVYIGATWGPLFLISVVVMMGVSSTISTPVLNWLIYPLIGVTLMGLTYYITPKTLHLFEL